MPLTSHLPTGTGSGAQDTGRQARLLGHVAAVDAAGFTLAVEPTLARDGALSDFLRIGATLKLPVGDDQLFGVIRKVTAGQSGALNLTVDLLGQYCEKHFSRGVRTFPLPGNPAYAASDSDLEKIYAPRNDGAIRVGTVHPSGTIPASLLVEKLLSKHFAVLGSTGTGKSSTVSLMIHRLVERCPNAHIVILDPHNEYARAFSGNGVHFSTDNLKLPYWLMNFEEHVEVFIGRDAHNRQAEIDILKRCLLAARKVSGPSYQLTKLTVDTPIPYKLTDLLKSIDDELGSFEKAEEVRPFLRLRNKVEELRADQRFAFMFSGMLMQDNLTSLVSQLLRFPVDGRPVTTLDLSGVPSDIVDVVVSLLSRLVFDFAMWSRRHADATPILLVCEEAHRYVPHAASDARIHAARRSLERIAKEGRKYGVALGLVSQRPSDLSESVLSQCGTIISMRMNNEKDRSYVADAMPEGGESFLASLPSLQNRECVIAGEGVGCPIRVQLDFLDEHRRPASNDPEFHESWRQDVDCLEELVNDTINNWRRGVR
ncbi:MULTISPECIES: ATP-binding protein [Kordiimonas]|jgi:hypothetical protein|uniref:Helicase HerA central domain-containing protein n=1 Tax=Kordiimonas lacus TaxID=637679 RepID=A0A1G6T5V1_9PROT|nr:MULTISPECIES: ATP-binding protein [Kordiimonas]SDD24409.1 hypothetical protein SAMN04488071_0126 [Kordiimonas lacus]